MRTINGIGVSPGVVSAPAFYVAKTKHAEIVLGSLSEILSALESVAKDLDSKAVQSNMTIAKDVIEAQAMIARDPELHSKIQSLIGDSSSDLRIVLEKSFEQFKIDLSNLGGYFAERVSDLDEIMHLVINKLLGLEEASIDILTDSILVAEDLSPADTATINLKFVKGLVVAKGGPTSHTAIVARNLGIPAIVGAMGAESIHHGDLLLLNGRKGLVIVDPSSTEINSAIKREKELKNKISHVSGPGRLRDKTLVNLLANAGNIQDAKNALERDAEGIGLFRTELLYLNQTKIPTINEQVALFSELFEIFKNKKIIIRTLDAGSDKPVPFLNSGKEENPALGVRGWRLVREHKQIISEQLKAISIAAENSKCEVWVMAPMIDTPNEAKEFSDLAKSFGIKKVGVMIETPAAAILADKIFAEVDFASLGTNDLTQYVMAADRLDSRLSDLTNTWHPSVLRMIQIAGSYATKMKKPLGVCGEAGADPLLAAVLIGLGVTSLSMSSNSIEEVKGFISTLTKSQCEKTALKVVRCSSAEQARDLAQKELN